MAKKKRSPKLKRVDIPEWDVYALVRPIGPKERDTLEAWIVSSMDGGTFTFRFFRGLVAVLVLANEEGKRIFTDEDAEDLNAWGNRTAGGTIGLDRIVSAALELSGIIPEDPDLGKAKDSTERFMFKMLRENPTFRFKEHYRKHYRPGSSALDLLLVALTAANEDERLAAAERFLRRRRPIHAGRWKGHRGEILSELTTSADLHGRTAKAEMTARTLAGIFPAAAQVRKDSGIFTPDAEMVEKTKAALNDEVTHDILGESWRKHDDPNLKKRKGKRSLTPLSEDWAIEEAQRKAWQEGTTFGLELAGATLTDESRTPSGAEDAIVAELDLKRILGDLSDREKRIISVMFNEEDRDAAAKKLKMKRGTLDVAIHRIKKKILSPE